MHISAAHFIPRESAGACSRVHGHTYTVNITVAGDELDDSGFLVNFSVLKKLVHGNYDHTLLNDHEDFLRTTGIRSRQLKSWRKRFMTTYRLI